MNPCKCACLIQAVVANCWLSEQCAAVYINNKQLQEKKKVQKHAWRFEDGSDVEMSWNLYMPGVGNAVVMQTGAASILDTYLFPQPWHLHCHM